MIVLVLPHLIEAWVLVLEIRSENHNLVLTKLEGTEALAFKLFLVPDVDHLPLSLLATLPLHIEAFNLSDVMLSEI